MSTDVQPPSPNLTFTSRRKQKLQRSSPVSMESQSARREHGRSASFTEFISKILPSYHGERGHSIREQFKDDGTVNPSELVFGLHGGRKPDERTSVGSDGSTTRKTLSKLRPSRSEGDDKKALKRGGVLKWIFGSMKKEKKVEKKESAITAPALPTPAILQDNVSGVITDEETIEELRRAIFKTQRLYDDKSARRERRRSLRESDDFLGVQGANPRTGCWDPSDNTTTSEPSQLSSSMAEKFAETRRLLAERKKRLTEIELMHQEVQERAQAFKELKEQERFEKEAKKAATFVPRLRRRGRWNVDENGWSSVAEPDLSPILQSVEGTPISTAVDRLFPMSTPVDPPPYIGAGRIEAHDYFGHRAASSPLARERLASQIEEETAPLSSHISIRRKPVVYKPNRRKDNVSSNTVVHTAIELDHTADPETPTHKIPKRVKSIRLRKPKGSISTMSVDTGGHFLEDTTNRPKPATQEENTATVTSLPSVPKKLLPTCEILIKNPLAGMKKTPVSLFHTLPPVYLKDPVAARTPSCPPELGLLQVWAPPTIIKTEPEIKQLSTNTLTTITTGHAHPSVHVLQLDGQQEMGHQGVDPALKHNLSRIPPRSSSQNEEQLRKTQSGMSPGHPATIVISSEHQLNPMKQRTAILCQNASPEAEKAQMKTKPTSTSTSLQIQHKQGAEAREAARLAFQALRQEVFKIKPKVQIEEALCFPEEQKDAHQNTKAAQDARDDIEGRFKYDHRVKMKIQHFSTSNATNPGHNNANDDSIVVWHPSPERKIEPVTGTPVANDMKAIIIHRNSPGRNHDGMPTSRALQLLTRKQIDLREAAWSCVVGLFVAMALLGKAFYIFIQTILTILLVFRIIMS